MRSLTFVETSFGPGTLVRFKDRKSHRWTYGIYRGTHKYEGRTVGYQFSDLPIGPITRWLGYWPEFIEAAVPAPESEK